MVCVELEATASTYSPLIACNRLEKANEIYEENGCKEISGYGKISQWINYTMILMIIVPGFRTAFNSSVSHMRR